MKPRVVTSLRFELFEFFDEGFCSFCQLWVLECDCHFAQAGLVLPVIDCDGVFLQCCGTSDDSAFVSSGMLILITELLQIAI